MRTRGPGSGTDDGTIAVLVLLRLRPGTQDAFGDQLREIVERVRREPACISIQDYRDPDDPTRFMLFESWRSAEEFAQFERGRDYMRDYMARVRPLWAAPREISTWTPQ